MKKIILAVIILTINSLGFEVTNQFWVDKTGSDKNKQINITCNNGKKGYIYYFPNVDGYYAKNSNNKYSSLNAAASKVCSTGSRKRTVISDSFVCEKESSIKKALKSKLSFSSARFAACFGKPTDYKDCFCLNQDYRAQTIGSYSSGKRIDGYFKLRDDKGNTLYVRKSTVK